ncbi:hypothetical protein MXB_4452 [Myxobolus squamalis]|nr:hypothetical protein MXB_4452 [Myxobolus squamalis]
MAFFLFYFKRTWIMQFEPPMSNIYDISECDIKGRTNNYLECYNRHLNEKFENSHPKLLGNISRIQKDQFYYTMQARNISSGSTLLQFPGTSFEKPTILTGYKLMKKIIDWRLSY